MHDCAGVDTDELLQEAIDTCPVNCIHWVRSLIICFAETCRELLHILLSIHAKSVHIIRQLCTQVTSPQLALLETTMAKMERVDAWILMMGGGNGVDVFMVSICFCRHRHYHSVRVLGPNGANLSSGIYNEKNDETCTRQAHAECSCCVQEAATAWEKRQAQIRARREGARYSWMPWSGQAAATANTYSGYSSGASAATGGRAQEAAAATAASARK